jgi:hypothetical protein
MRGNFGLQCAAIVDRDLIAFLGLMFAFDCAGHFDLDFLSSNEGSGSPVPFLS